MKNSKKIRVFDDQFRLRMLKEYYEGSECLHDMIQIYFTRFNKFNVYEKF